MMLFVDFVSCPYLQANARVIVGILLVGHHENMSSWITEIVLPVFVDLYELENNSTVVAVVVYFLRRKKGVSCCWLPYW